MNGDDCPEIRLSVLTKSTPEHLTVPMDLPDLCAEIVSEAL